MHKSFPGFKPCLGLGADLNLQYGAFQCSEEDNAESLGTGNFLLCPTYLEEARSIVVQGLPGGGVDGGG